MAKNKKPNQHEAVELVVIKMKSEGFDYCFRHYSSFGDVRDKEFQKLRKDYCKAADALEAYVDELAAENGIDPDEFDY